MMIVFCTGRGLGLFSHGNIRFTVDTNSIFIMISVCKLEGLGLFSREYSVYG
jgi:hypothetical protein